MTAPPAAPPRACGWCAEELPQDALRCRFCGERCVCGRHPLELVQGRCGSCGRPVCARCLQGDRCQECPPPEPAPDPAQAAGVPERPRDLLDPVDAAGWVFRDEDWPQKLIVGAVLTLTSVLLLPIYLLAGYATRIAQQQHAHPGQLPLPGFDRLGDLFWLGFKHVLALALPVLVSLGVLLAPLGFVVAWSSGGPARGAAALLLALFGYLTFLFLTLAYPAVVPAIELVYLRTGSPLAGLQLGEVWREITRQPGEYLLLTIFYWILACLAGAGVLLCGVGLLVTGPWGTYATGCLLGRYLAHQDARDAGRRDELAAILANDPTRRAQPPSVDGASHAEA